MKIVLLESLGISQELLDSYVKPLKEKGYEFAAYERNDDPAVQIEEAKDADILIIANMPLKAEVINACPNLKYIDVAFTGVDHVALDAAKAALGIHSPSKEFGDMGENCDRSFGASLQKFAYVAESAASDVGTGTVTALEKSIYGLSDSINDNIDLNPVITPVLDLSNIKSGGQQIATSLNKGLLSSIKNADLAMSNVPKNNNSDTQNNQNGSNTSTVNFTQINNSPKQPSRLSQYRDTKNLLALAKGVVP